MMYESTYMNQSPGEISLQFTVAVNFLRVQLVHLSLVVASVAVIRRPAVRRDLLLWILHLGETHSFEEIL
jgi:hypothetical protein